MAECNIWNKLTKLLFVNFCCVWATADRLVPGLSRLRKMRKRKSLQETRMINWKVCKILQKFQILWRNMRGLRKFLAQFASSKTKRDTYLHSLYRKGYLYSVGVSLDWLSRNLVSKLIYFLSLPGFKNSANLTRS